MTKHHKTTLLRIILFSGTVTSLFFVPWIIVKAWIIPLPTTIQEQVNETLGHGFDGMIVYIDQKGKSPAFYTGGWKDKYKKIPANPNSLFKIASISKLYSAVAVTKLVGEQKLNFDNTLSYYLPELTDSIAYAEKITLKMLVQHRSGIPNFTDNPAFWQNEQENGKNALSFALQLPTSFQPGKGYEYSNTNYLLLRRIMNKVLGYHHHQYIQDKILTPLKLKNTYFSISEVDLDNVMSGYYVGYEEDFKTNENGMLATAEDVGVFLRALNEGTVFENGEKELYPYEFNHGGLVIGYQSLAEYHKDIDAVIIQFINTTDFNGYEWNLSEVSMNRIVQILRNQKK